MFSAAMAARCSNDCGSCGKHATISSSNPSVAGRLEGVHTGIACVRARAMMVSLEVVASRLIMLADGADSRATSGITTPTTRCSARSSASNGGSEKGPCAPKYRMRGEAT